MASLRFLVDGSPVEIALPVNCTIGRARTNSIAVPNDRFASKEHASILDVEGAFYIEDLQSGNGTRILRGNTEVKVEGRQRLQHADVISVGGLRVVFLARVRSTPEPQERGRSPASSPDMTQLRPLQLPQRRASDETVIVRGPTIPQP